MISTQMIYVMPIGYLPVEVVIHQAMARGAPPFMGDRVSPIIRSIASALLSPKNAVPSPASIHRLNFFPEPTPCSFA